MNNMGDILPAILLLIAAALVFMFPIENGNTLVELVPVWFNQLFTFQGELAGNVGDLETWQFIVILVSSLTVFGILMR